MATYQRKKYMVYFLDGKREPQEHLLTFFDVITLRALVGVSEQGVQLKELTTRARELSKQIDKSSIQAPIRTLYSKSLMIDVMRREAVTLNLRHFFSPVVQKVEEVMEIVTESQPA